MDQELTLEQAIMKVALDQFHESLMVDNDQLDSMCEALGCTEYELFSGLENLAQDNGFELDANKE